jgi:hypothetical protein
MFLRRGKSTEGGALIGFGVFACIFSAIGLSGAFVSLPETGRAGALILIGIPVGIAAIIGGIVSLYRDARRQG